MSTHAAITPPTIAAVSSGTELDFLRLLLAVPADKRADVLRELDAICRRHMRLND